MRAKNIILIDYFKWKCSGNGYNFQRIQFFNYSKGKIGGAYYASKNNKDIFFEEEVSVEDLYNFELERQIYGDNPISKLPLMGKPYSSVN